MSHWDIDVWFIDEWLRTLDRKSHEQVIAALELLQQRGPALGRPLVDSVTGSRHSNMKELRPGSSGGSELRVLFAFDPNRRAILLVAGDKRGDWRTWYARNIPLADCRLDQHLKHARKGTSRGQEFE